MWFRREAPSVSATTAEPSRAAGTPITANVSGLKTDQDIEAYLSQRKSGIKMINWGSSWCTHCKSMYPHFLNLASKNASHSFAVAQLDYLEQAAPSVAVAPAFSVYRQGRKVDDFSGASPQRLMDHAWLHGLET